MTRDRSYLTLSFTVAEAAEEAAADLLVGVPVLGSLVEPAADGFVRIVVYLEEGHRDRVSALASRLAGLAAFDVAEGVLPAEDWLAGYRARVQPFSLGRRWWIDPHPEAPTPPPPGRLRLAIEPRTAFGSGSHESTQLVLLELEDAPPAGLEVLDVGTGSGILALASLALGAARVVALDIDLHAVWLAQGTSAEQESEWRPQLFAGPVGAVGAVSFPLVLCNMVPERFVPLLPELRRLLSPAGSLMLSGLLASQRAMVAGELAAAGLAVVSERRRHEWASLRVRHA